MVELQHSYATARPSHEPRADHRIEVRGGRGVQVAEWGPVDGSPLVFINGTPSSRLMCPDALATEEAGVRFIAFDRPGYGRSERHPDRLTRIEVAADVGEILDRLDIERAPVVGWSGGGPYALACAATMPDRVRSAATLCAPSGSTLSAAADPEVAEIRQLLTVEPEVGMERLRDRCSWLSADPLSMLRVVEQFAPEVLTAPGMRETYAAWVTEAAAVSIDGYVDDWLLDAQDDYWGFDPSAITATVTCWFGARDRIVTREDAERQATLVSDATTIGCDECGHLVPIAHWPEILATVLGDTASAR